MSLQEVYDAVVDLDIDSIGDLILKEIENKTPVDEILNNGLISAMDQVGKLFSAGEIYVPEMLVAAHTMKAGLDILTPHMKLGNGESKGTIVIGSVKGDLHDIGKNLVVMMLEGGGFKVIDLGIDVPTENFIKAITENNADIVGLSALLTTTMPAMAESVKEIKEQGLDIKIMVGGAPVTQEFANEIGADGYSDDAPGAVVLARTLV